MLILKSLSAKSLFMKRELPFPGYSYDTDCIYINGTGTTEYEFYIQLNRCGTLGGSDHNKKRDAKFKNTEPTVSTSYFLKKLQGIYHLVSYWFTTCSTSKFNPCQLSDPFGKKKLLRNEIPVNIK